MLFPTTYQTPCYPISYRRGGGRFLRDDDLERCRKTPGPMARTLTSPT